MQEGFVRARSGSGLPMNPEASWAVETKAAYGGDGQLTAV